MASINQFLQLSNKAQKSLDPMYTLYTILVKYLTRGIAHVSSYASKQFPSKIIIKKIGCWSPSSEHIEGPYAVLTPRHLVCVLKFPLTRNGADGGGYYAGAHMTIEHNKRTAFTALLNYYLG